MFNKTILIAMLFTSLSLPGFESSSKYSAIRSPNSSLGEGPQFYLEDITLIGEAQKAFIQFYIQVNYSELQFVWDKDHYRANYYLEVQVYGSNDELLDLQSQTDVVKVSTYQETRSSHIANLGVNTKLSSHWFDAGEYVLVVDIKEDLSGERVELAATITHNYAREKKVAIYLCRNPKFPVEDIWVQLAVHRF